MQQCRRPSLSVLVTTLVVTTACAHQPTTAIPTAGDSEARAMLEVLAADSLEGRGTGTPGSLKAARFIASRMQALGLSPAGDSGFYQRVPLQRDTLAGAGGASLRLGKSGDATTNLIPAFNVVAILPGSDSALRSQAILVDAHYDHLGIGQLVAGDSIYNGADDDGSGVV